MVAALAGLLAALVAVPALGATPAQRQPAGVGHLYWSEPENGREHSGPGINTIWRADVSGKHVDRNFVRVPASPGPVAVGGSYLYWGDQRGIGRAKLDGTHVRRSFIHAGAEALAVSAHYIYWISGFSPGKLWRADLDGSHVQRLAKLGDGGYFGGIAVNRAHVYWSNRDRGTIGRADLNGTHIDRHLITGLKDPNGLALSGRNLFWASTDPSTTSNSIGRSSLNGTHVKRNFITGAAYPFGVAVGGGHVYWANFNYGTNGTIGRANLDATHVQQKFIDANTVPQGQADPFYLAVGP